MASLATTSSIIGTIFVVASTLAVSCTLRETAPAAAIRVRETPVREMPFWVRPFRGQQAAPTLVHPVSAVLAAEWEREPPPASDPPPSSDLCDCANAAPGAGRLLAPVGKGWG